VLSIPPNRRETC